MTQPGVSFHCVHVHALAKELTAAVAASLVSGESCISGCVSGCYLASLQAALIEDNLEAVDGAINVFDCYLASLQAALIEYNLEVVDAAINVFDCYLESLQAALIEYNLEAVDAAINAVREALASGLDWRELGQMIKAERRAGNPVAGLIDSLALDKNKITVVLENFLDEEDADDEAMTRPATKVGSQE